LAGAVVVCALSAHALAQPGDRPIAKAIVDDAVAQYDLRHFQEASALFEKAYQVDPAPVLLFNIGQCHRRLGNNELALFFYRRYLDQAPADAPERQEVVKRVADLDRSIREQADLKDKPPPGVTRDVAASGAAPPSLAGPVAIGVGVTPPAAQPGQGPAAPRVDDSDDSRRTLRNVAWVAGGLGVGALVFGIVEAATQSSRVDRFNDHLGPTAIDPTGSSGNCGGGEPGHGGPGCADLYSDISTGRTLAIIGLAGGGALMAGSGILFLASTPRQATGTSIGAGCGPNLYSPGVLCRMSF
jgi:hypothetical protein